MTNPVTGKSEGNGPGGRSSASSDRSIISELEEAAPHVKARVREMLETGKESMESWKDRACDTIRDRPMQSVLIAAAAGAILGLVLGRRGR